MTETKISNLNTSLYIPEIQKSAFSIPHVQIMDTNHCGNSHRTEFRLQKNFDMCYVAVIMLKA